MMAVSLLASILFLGGWHGPIPIASMLGLSFGDGGDANFWYGFAGNVLGTLNMLLKGVIGVTVMMWVRWTLPRLRIDQVITTCLKYCVPIAAVMFLGATWWQYALPNRSAFGLAPAPSYGLEERWPSTDEKSSAAAAARAAENQVTSTDRTVLVNLSRTK
jgi:NADH-quinone oxidoreductase subunit H